MPSVSDTERHWSRAEYVLVACYAAVLGWFAQSYHPTNPRGTELLWLVFGVAGAYAVARAAAGPRAWLDRRVVRWLLWVPKLVVLFALAQYVATSFLVLHMRSPPVARVAAVAEIAVWIGLWAWARKRPAMRRRARVTAGAILFSDAILYVLLCAWMWQPPAAEECAGVVRPGIVDRLTPQEWADGLSYPYELHYLPAEDKVVASFKMAGNTVLDVWDVPRSNRMAVIDVSDPAAPRLAELPLPGLAIPEHMAYRAASREVIVNRVGYTDNTLDFVELADFPELRLRLSKELDFPPHGVVVPDDEAWVGVISVHLEMLAVDPVTAAELWRKRIPYNGPIATLTNLARMPGSSMVYLSTFGRPLTEYDYASHETRTVQVDFSGGDLTTVGATRSVYQTDMMFGQLNEVDARTMRVMRTLDLGYQPRPVAADYKRDLLFVGGWFTGEVHLYRLSTLEPLGEPIPVGSYLRKFSWDAARGHLYTGSRCGVYRVDVDALTPR